MNLIFDKTNHHFKQNLPFVLYRKPNEINIIGVFQKNADLHLINDFSEKGFAFCSFDGNTNIIIPENKSEVFLFENNFPKEILESNSFESEYSEFDFVNLVSKGIEAIKNNEFQKVVLSRKEIIKLKDSDLVSIFIKLIQNYKSAFCYCFFHPKIGLWFGATPEQLVQVSETEFQTVSLAGTQKFENSTPVVWQEKEKLEQKFVTDFILENLNSIDQNIQASEPFTIQAGNLLHIKSTISGNLNSDFNLKKLLEILHPTPAVCGLPRDESKKFILENENYNREFYAGFLGEINTNNKTDLFVNLRCMQFVANFAHIYVGCGVTKDSIAENEFQETVNKSMTMKIIL